MPPVFEDRRPVVLPGPVAASSSGEDAGMDNKSVILPGPVAAAVCERADADMVLEVFSEK